MRYLIIEDREKGERKKNALKTSHHVLFRFAGKEGVAVI